jgi:hypothetical protein
MRKVELTFLELRERSQDNLIGFLVTDLGLGETMLKMAQTTQISEHRLRLLGNVQAILRAVEHFEGRIEDRKIRSEIHDQADKLKKASLK